MDTQVLLIALIVAVVLVAVLLVAVLQRQRPAAEASELVAMRDERDRLATELATQREAAREQASETGRLQ
ncbi:MAG TPA: hypothetical protein VLZ76_11740, partial [Lysobacter sp.]|nr:hypothetical protein [Lysobacter sp.]